MASNRLKFQDRGRFMGRRTWGATATGRSHTFSIMENIDGRGYSATVKPVTATATLGFSPETTEHLDNSLVTPYPTYGAAVAACEKRNDEIRSKLN